MRNFLTIFSTVFLIFFIPYNVLYHKNNSVRKNEKTTMGMCEIVIRKETGCADRDSYLMVMCAYKKWVKFEPGLMRVFNL